MTFIRNSDNHLGSAENSTRLLDRSTAFLSLYSLLASLDEQLGIMARLKRWSALLNTLQIKNDYSQIPAGLSWRSNAFFIVSTVAIGLFTDLFLYGLVVPILPFLLRDKVDVPEDKVQSYVSGLLALFAGCSVITSPFAGLAADKLSSRQGPFLLGLVIMLFATTLLFLGESVATLMIARGLQGVSGGFVWTIGLALCLETVGPENLGKTIGSVSLRLGGSPWNDTDETRRFSASLALETSSLPSLAAFSTRRSGTWVCMLSELGF